MSYVNPITSPLTYASFIIDDINEKLKEIDDKINYASKSGIFNKLKNKIQLIPKCRSYIKKKNSIEIITTKFEGIQYHFRMHIKHQCEKIQNKEKLFLIFEHIDNYLRHPSIEAFHSISQYNREVIVKLLPQSEIDDQIVSAKNDAMQSNIFVYPKFIRFYGINEEELYEIAKMAALERGCEITYYIERYGIKDPKKLFEIAKIAVASSNKYCRFFSQYTSEHIQKYKLQNVEMLFDLAKISADHDPLGTSKYIKNYGIKDEDKLAEIAKISAANLGIATSRYIENYGIKDESKLIEIAKISAAQNGGATSLHIKNYKITNKAALLEIAKIAVSNDDITTALDNLKNYGIDDFGTSFKILKLAIHNLVLNTLDDVYTLNFNIAGFTEKQLLARTPKIEALKSLGLKLLLNPEQPLLQQEKNVLGSLLDLIESPSSQKKEDDEKSIRQRIHVTKWIGGYISRYQLWSSVICLNQIITTIPNNKNMESLSYKSKATLDIIEKGVHSRLNKNEQKIAKRREILDFHSLLKAIAKLRNPPYRHLFKEMLFRHLFFAQTLGPLEVYKQLDTTKSISTIQNEADKKEKGLNAILPKFGTTDKAIFRLLLTILIYTQEDKNYDFTDCRPLFMKWKEVISLLSDTFYKDATKQMPVITCLYLLIHEENLSPIEKGMLVRATFNLGKNANTPKERIAIINSNLSFLESIILSRKDEVLKKLISEIKEEQFSSEKSLELSLKSVFNLIIGEVEIKDFTEKFQTTFLSARQPSALFTYANKLQGMSQNEIKPILLSLKILYENILEGMHHRNRYSTLKNEHLKLIFSWKTDKVERKAWKKNWRTYTSRPVEIKKIEGNQNNESFNITKYFNEKICLDKHLDPNDYPVLVQHILKPDNTLDAIKNSLQELTNLEEEILLKENKSDSKEKIQKLYLQKVLINMMDVLKSPFEKDQLLFEAKNLMALIFPLQNNHQFLRDLDDLKENFKIKITDYSGWTLEDTDHWEDLLLSGTEVLGSCQSIYCRPDTNKCLINYILDGKNRIVVLKNADGYIQARVLIRLLWDDKLKQPVLYRERLYKAAGVSADWIEQEIDSICIDKAKTLGISLVKTKESNDAEVASYPNNLKSLNGCAPFEYVDAGKLGITNGSFTIASDNIISIKTD